MGRKKGSLNKKTLRKLNSIGLDGKAVSEAAGKSTDELEHLKEQMATMQDVISDLTKQIEDKKAPSKLKKIKSTFNMDDLGKIDILTNREVSDLEETKQEAIDELNGKRKILKEALGGTVKAYQDQTAPDKNELLKRIAFANRALAQQGKPTISEHELNSLKKKYDVLTEELRKLVPSKKDQWAVGTPGYKDAQDKHILLMTKYADKVKTWQNIGKLLDADNPTLWNLDVLGK